MIAGQLPEPPRGTLREVPSCSDLPCRFSYSCGGWSIPCFLPWLATCTHFRLARRAGVQAIPRRTNFRRTWNTIGDNPTMETSLYHTLTTSFHNFQACRYVGCEYLSYSCFLPFPELMSFSGWLCHLVRCTALHSMPRIHGDPACMTSS